MSAHRNRTGRGRTAKPRYEDSRHRDQMARGYSSFDKPESIDAPDVACACGLTAALCRSIREFNEHRKICPVENGDTCT